MARYGKRVHFQCGSYGIGGNVDGSFYTSDHCADIREIADLRTERDALQARVTLQKCLLDQRWEMMCELEEVCGTKDVSKAVEYVKVLKARVNRLEEAGDDLDKIASDYALLVKAFQHWELHCEAVKSINNWKQAKEFKP